MWFTIVAVATGFGVGMIAGGRPRYLAARRFIALPLLLSGLVLQAVSSRIDGGASVALLILSYVLLVSFAASNLQFVGLALVLLGLALNLLTIAVNQGMPVRPAAVVAAHLASPSEVAALHLRGKHHLERRDDRLMAISDILPDPLFHEVLSFGDLILSVGVADVIAHLLRPPRRRGTYA